MRTEHLEDAKLVNMDFFDDFDWANATKADMIAFGYAKGFGENLMNKGELTVLYETLERVGENPTIVELGRCHGSSTRLFMAYLRRFGGTLYTVDIRIFPEFFTKMERYGFNFMGAKSEEHAYTVKVFTENTLDFKPPPDRSVDLLLIDTSNEYDQILGEYFRFKRCVGAGKYIAVHDAKAYPQVKEAIEVMRKAERGFLEERYDNDAGFGLICFSIR